MSDLSQFIVDVPDFPKEGIIFKDISPLLRNHFPQLITEMSGLITKEEWNRVEFLAGIEARGFAVASALAMYMGKGFVPIRKKGKLPPKVVQMSYDLEYGQDALEMHHGGGNVLLVDDILATGGTFEAAAKLCELTGHNIVGLHAIVDLAFLNRFKWNGEKVKSLITYH